ncbi:CDP-diacylglycerol--glycerol-3-phosphate 3-phosphatidyltransferase [Methanofollis sp. W23]|uniref:CDP-alcohol phosphatidyltransferase family protein n=1 Tax=Methanofollis sp. W23 TaxID=2817849 RepID=UPI001AE4E974|nr:CDP-alcohol phosphatidyltransferase family protein [Methanofollis sp. W23]MBP2145603.1 CDP-diacylglycerol--glycerol-3-phosphate 3-phosphatidyltransferase [Methanofollis sp. W23]
MIDGWMRERTEGMLSRVAAVIGKTGVTPNMLTATGLVIMVGAAGLIAMGHLLAAGLVLGFGGVFDALDGAVARTNGQASRFGAFFDSVLDRYAEAFLFGGVFLYCAGDETARVLTFAALVGSLMVSYTRARAEGLGVECRTGLFTRLERMLVLIVGLLTGLLVPALWVLAVFTNLTAVQRMWHVRMVTRGE